MLTVPGLCWLCQMPLALSHWGDMFRMRARRPSEYQPVPAMRITCRASFTPLRSLPAKAAALAASGKRQRL